MPRFFIRAVDSEFLSRDEGAEYDLPETALRLGLRGAAAMAIEKIEDGAASVAIEVTVERENRSQVLRSILAMSVSHVMIASD